MLNESICSILLALHDFHTGCWIQLYLGNSSSDLDVARMYLFYFWEENAQLCCLIITFCRIKTSGLLKCLLFSVICSSVAAKGESSVCSALYVLFDTKEPIFAKSILTLAFFPGYLRCFWKQGMKRSEVASQFCVYRFSEHLAFHYLLREKATQVQLLFMLDFLGLISKCSSGSWKGLC